MANFKEQKKYHFTYRTTNLVNGRYYLGMHSTNRIDDGYLGSGKRLYYELNKYGRDNFKFEILKQFNSREELVQAEISLITEQDLKNPNCLNCKPGGSGGLSNKEHYNRFVEAGKANLINSSVNRQESLNRTKKTTQYREAMSEALKKSYRNRSGNFKGKKHSQETIEKMKAKAVGRGTNHTNSQYGTCWITNEVDNKKINKGDTIPEGWRLGRKIK